MATTLYTGDALFAGGDSDGTPDSTAEIYSLKTNTFSTSLISMALTTGREQATATLLPNGDVLVAGGFTTAPGAVGLSPTATAELFITASSAFQSTGSMNIPRANMTATLAPNGSVFIAGGDSTGGVILGSTELYSASTETFAAMTDTVSLSIGRELPTATLLTNGQVLIAGGLTTSPTGGKVTTNTTDLYTP
jgi:hypothetical protein